MSRSISGSSNAHNKPGNVDTGNEVINNSVLEVSPRLRYVFHQILAGNFLELVKKERCNRRRESRKTI
jgi:hypothetical protein